MVMIYFGNKFIDFREKILQYLKYISYFLPHLHIIVLLHKLNLSGIRIYLFICIILAYENKWFNLALGIYMLIKYVQFTTSVYLY